MILEVSVRDAEVLLRLRNGQKRMVFAVANAARATALAVQKEQRRRLGDVFTLRDKADFLRRQAAVITFPRPKEGIVEAKVEVAQKPRLFLSGYEEGFERRPIVGKNVAVPVEARTSKTAPVSEHLFIRRLALRRTHTRPSRKNPGPRRGVVTGKFGTYVVPEVGIFQRSSGTAPSRLLYAFHDPFRQPPRFRWLATSIAVARPFFLGELRRQVVETIRFQSRRG